MSSSQSQRDATEPRAAGPRDKGRRAGGAPAEGHSGDASAANRPDAAPPGGSQPGESPSGDGRSGAGRRGDTPRADEPHGDAPPTGAHPGSHAPPAEAHPGDAPGAKRPGPEPTDSGSQGSEPETPPAGTRRRPTHRKGRATLTRESVGRAALGFLGRYGAAELTMRSLAAELGVSPRALYNYVDDRRDLIAVAAEIFEADWHAPALDPAPGRWRDSLRAYCRELRAHYRRHPGMTTLALSENVTMARHPRMLRNVDALVGFLAAPDGPGLPLRDAYLGCMETLRTVVGFVEFQDRPHDRPPAHLDPADLDAVPPPWLRDEAQELPHLRRAGEELAPEPPDALFEFSLDVLVGGFAARARRRGAASAPETAPPPRTREKDS